MANLLLKQTIWVNFLRSFCTGIIIAIVGFFMPTGAESIGFAVLLVPFFVPLIYFASYLLSFILKLFGLGGIGNIMCMLFSVPGDPLVFLLSQVKPELVPVENFKFLNFAGVYLVYQDYIPNIVSESEVSNDLGCPFKGVVIGEEETTVLGFNYPISSTIFNIGTDWVVSSQGKSVGYIDKDGQIRSGLKGDPNATLAPGKIIGKIKFDKLWVDDKMIGTLHP